ncbi:MAG: cadherin-like beta sandwich domain-containing protein, partial [Clostridia bacterium]
MNKIKITITSILLFILIAITTNNTYAGTIGMDIPSSIEVGKTVTMTISGNGVSGGVKISTSNPGVISISKSTGFIDGKQGQNVYVNLTAKATGNVAITVGPMSTDSLGNDNLTPYTGGNVSKNITVTSPPPVVPPTLPPANNTNNTNNTNNNTKVATPEKGMNTYLKLLQVDQEGLTPVFNKNKYTYSIVVNESVVNLGVTAKAEDATSKVTINGNTDLKKGDNTVTITVKSKNGSKKIYTILVNKTNNPDESNVFLENLIIENSKFKTEFSPEIFEYECENIDSSIDSLKILAFAKNKKAKVEIIGNEKLVAGENIINVKVTSENGSTTKEYKIKVIKDEEKVVATVAETNALKNNDLTFFEKAYKFFKKNGLILISFTLVIVEFIEILILYFGWYVPKKIEIKKENDVAIFNKRRKLNLD